MLGKRFRAAELVTLIYECFFKNPRMRGNREVKFFDKINMAFVCLVAAAIQHCLKECVLGEQVRNKELIDFNYDTAAG